VNLTPFFALSNLCVRAVESMDGATNAAGFRGGGAPVKREMNLFMGEWRANRCDYALRTDLSGP